MTISKRYQSKDGPWLLCKVLIDAGLFILEPDSSLQHQQLSWPPVPWMALLTFSPHFTSLSFHFFWEDILLIPTA